jgi:hypothetical protein
MSSDTVYKSNSYGAFEKLNGDNFPAWKAAMIFHLGAEPGKLLWCRKHEIDPLSPWGTPESTALSTQPRPRKSEKALSRSLDKEE